jgi:DNA mismatch endonuclease, patch repair protein
MDVLTREQRRRCMARIKGRNTKPEVVLRKALFSLGFRYRLHQKRLPGTPDLVFPKYHAVVFIHGCFWHGHQCNLFVVPATNTAFWMKKIGGNRARDERAVTALRALDWRVMTVWECAVRGPDRQRLDTLAMKISRWLLAKKPVSEFP